MHKNLTAEEYLQIVIDSWSAFCKSHSPLENAIKEVLAENKRLKKQVKELKEYINSMEKNSKKDKELEVFIPYAKLKIALTDFLHEAELHGNYDLEVSLKDFLATYMERVNDEENENGKIFRLSPKNIYFLDTKKQMKQFIEFENEVNKNE
jgi:hypothetical protein